MIAVPVDAEVCERRADHSMIAGGAQQLQREPTQLKLKSAVVAFLSKQIVNKLTTVRFRYLERCFLDARLILASSVITPPLEMHMTRDASHHADLSGRIDVITRSYECSLAVSSSRADSTATCSTQVAKDRAAVLHASQLVHGCTSSALSVSRGLHRVH